MNIVPLTIESMVAILLLLTILYCVRLNGQLNRLRADESAMREIIADLTAATDRAERSIVGLKMTVNEADQNLGERLRVAERFCADMAQQTEAGTDLLKRLTRIASARTAAPNETAAPAPFQPAAPDPKAIAAAAQAFAERAQARAKSRAA